jgi:outer membrane protein OmpA-like peptidoglycan-associated protein
MTKKITPVLALLAFLISSCIHQKVPGKDVVCPPPPAQNCQPLVWHGIETDTSASYREVADKYYIFSPVHSLNTPENEWSLSFIDKTRAVLTFDDEDIQTMMIAKFTTDTKAVFESGVGTPFEGSSGAMSIRGNKVVIAASSDPEDPSEFIGNSNLYTAELQGNMIVNAKYMGDIVHKNDWSWESQPSMSKDGKVVFFASDRNLKHGTDIFFTVKLPGGKWSEPVALGSQVNTACEEITPFLTEDGKDLYFSSCGHETVGGYDIFVSHISDEFWQAAASGDMDKISNAVKYFSEAVNLKPPLNTNADEIFPSSPEDPKNILFYASNQASAGIRSILFRRGGFDIYRRRLVQGRIKQIVKKDHDVNININSPEVISEFSADIEFSPTYKLKGTVYNNETHERVPYADVIIRQLDGEKETIQREHYLDKDREVDISSQGGDKYFDSFKINADKNGDYEVVLEKDRTYEVTAQKEDMFFDSFKTRVEKEDPRTEIEQDLFIPPDLTLRINFPTDQYRRPYKYSIDTNGIETNQTWKESINLLAQNILISKNVIDSLVLIGHTDDQGTEKYNYKLGLNRVKFIIEQLVKRGVPRNILVGISKGESDLLPRRKNESKKLWRKRCRRVELVKILKK